MHVLAILLIVLIQLVLAVTQIQNTGVGTIPFSGVYNPSLRFQSDDSAGAFLVAKDRLVNAIVPFHNSTSYKSRSYLDESAFVTVLRVKCSSCLNFLTRDFLDFFVEHLPSTINQLDPSQREAATYVLNGLKRTTKKLRLLAAPAHNYDKRLNQTVAVLVYNGDLTRRVSSKMKLTLFQATFWSVYRYYHNVVVVTKSAVEQSTVQGLKLPTQEIININLPVASKSKKQKYAVRAAIAHGALIKGALEVAALRLVQRGGSWGEFRYAYMSTADQLLHSRRFRDIYDAIDLGTEGNFLIAPHRMQVGSYY